MSRSASRPAKSREANRRRFFATGEQLEPRYALNVDDPVEAIDSKVIEPMRQCSYCDIISWVGNAWAVASDFIGSFEGQFGDLNLSARSSQSMSENSDYLPSYSTREQRDGIASAKVKVPGGNTWTSLTVETTFDSVTGSTRYYNTSGLANSTEFVVSDLVDVAGLPAGRYPYHMDFVGNRTGGGTDVFDYDGFLLVTGPSDSLMSPGWRIGGLDRLSFDADGVTWETAGGALYWFDENAGDYTTPSGELTGAVLEEDGGVFTITDRWHNQTIFNAAGLLTEKIDRYGNSTLYIYTDADGDSDDDDLSEIQSFDGSSMTYTYDTSSPYLLESITDFDGRTVTLGYNGSDELETLTFPDPGANGDPLIISYTYDATTHLLEAVTEGDGAGDLEYTTEYTYSATTQALTSVEHPDGTVDNYTGAWTLGLGGTSGSPALPALSSAIAATKTTVDGNGTEDLTTSYSIGPFGRVRKIVDPLGNTTEFTFDIYGRVTKRTDPDPDDGASLPAPETDYVYTDGNLTSMELPDGSARTWEYDATWNIPTSYTDELGLVTIYDVNNGTGNVDSVRQVIGENDLESDEEDDIVTAFTYYALGDPGDPPAGLVASKTDALGRVTLYDYNARGNPTTVTYAYGSADEATVTYHYAGLSTVDYQDDELGRRTEFEYDDLLRLVATKLPDPDGAGPLQRPVYTYEYDIHDRVVTEVDPLEREKFTTYDKRSRVIKIELPDHDGDSELTTTEMTYTRMGLLASVNDPLDRLTEYGYDNLGRQTSVILPEVADPTTAVNEVQVVDFDSGTEGTFKLNGNSKSGTIDLASTSNFQTVLDSLWGAGNTSVKVTATEATVTFRGDLSGTNVAQMTISNITGTKGATPAVSTDTGGVAADLVNPTIETAFDNLGRVISRKDELGQQTTYAYTNFGRNVEITLPDPDGAGKLSAPVLYKEFDPAGNLVSETDANGGETTRDFDVLGRLTKVTLADPDGGGGLESPSTTYQFDLVGNLRYVTDALGSVTEYQYDSRDRQVKVISEDPDGPGGLSQLVTETEYDDASQVTKVTAPGDRVTTYEHDGLGRTISITGNDPDGKGSLIWGNFPAPVTRFSFDAAGQMIGMTDPMGHETAYGYDLLGNQILVVQADPDGDGPQDAPLTYREFDAAGQLLSESQGLALKEVQRLYFGSLAAPISPTAGTYELTFDGQTTATLDATDSAVTVQSELEQLSNIGEGNIVVSATPNGFMFVFRGAFSNEDVPQIAVTSNALVGTAGVDISVDVIQSRISDENETQEIDLGSAWSGTFDVAGNSTSATVYSLDQTGLQAAMDSIWGSGNTVVYLLSGDTYQVFFTGSFGSQDIPQMTIASNSTNGSPSTSTYYDGVTGQPDILEITITGGAIGGTWDPIIWSTLYDLDIPWDASAEDVEEALAGIITNPFTVTGSNGGPWTVTGDATYTSLDLDVATDDTTPLIADVDDEVVEVQPGVWDWWNATTYAYDNLGRTVEVVSADPDGLGDQEPSSTKFFYSLTGNLLQVLDPLKHETNYLYDLLNRRTSSEDALGGLTSFSYDANGNMETLTDPVGNTTSWTFDALNRVTAEENELHHSRFFYYDAVGNLIRKTDRNERETVYERDNLQRIVAEEWWVNDAFPTIDVTTSTEGTTGVNEVQVLTISDATGGVFTLSFEGQTTTPIDFDATNTEVEAALEALSNVDTVTVSGSAGGPYTITFTGALAETDVPAITARANGLSNASLLSTINYLYNDVAELAEVSDDNATYEFLYDGLGRVTNYVQNITGLNPEIEFFSLYNSASRRMLMQAYLDSEQDFLNGYGYDAMLRLTAVEQMPAYGEGNSVAPKWIDIHYNEISQYTRIDRYQSIGTSEFVASTHYLYDDANRLTKLVHSESTTEPTSGWGSDPLAGYQFTYDAASRFTSINSYLDGVTNYAHDNTNQLVGADHASATDESYEYDSNGNRVMSGYDVDPNNQLVSDGTYNYTYDNEGNRETRTRISDGYVTLYEWDFRNRLVKVTEEDNSSNVLQVTENNYDAFNQWIHRSFDEDGPGGTAAVDTFFVYESGKIVLQFEGDDDSDLSHRYLWGEHVDQLFADEQVTSLGSAGTVIWPLGDQVGTLRDLVTYNSGTDDATVANHREFDSFGNLTDETNDTVDLLFAFTGRPFDETTGLQNNLHRWYDPAVGRWVSEDPIGFAGNDANLQRYVGNAPVMFRDPLGLEIFKPSVTQPGKLVIVQLVYQGDDGAGIGRLAGNDDFKNSADAIAKYLGSAYSGVVQIQISDVNKVDAAGFDKLKADLVAKLGSDEVSRMVFVGHGTVKYGPSWPIHKGALIGDPDATKIQAGADLAFNIEDSNPNMTSLVEAIKALNLSKAFVVDFETCYSGGFAKEFAKIMPNVAFGGYYQPDPVDSKKFTFFGDGVPYGDDGVTKKYFYFSTEKDWLYWKGMGEVDAGPFMEKK